MSHSQWEKKKYKKAAAEGKMSQIYSKVVKLITMEAKKANGNREATGLKAAILKAREIDMPNDNIERAISRANDTTDNLETIIYEAYGPGGAGLVIVAVTSSRNKAAQEIKFILSENGGTLGAIGSVTWSFEKELTPEGFIWKPSSTLPLLDDDKRALTHLLEKLEDNEEVQDVFTNAELD